MAASLFNGVITRFHHHVFTEGNVPLTEDIMLTILNVLQHGTKLVTENGVLFSNGDFCVDIRYDGRIELSEPAA
jgi:hypothetical protein